MASTLAVLDDKTKKGDYDLLFTVYGIVAIKHGVIKAPIAYESVSWSAGKVKSLIIDGKFENSAINSNELFKLIQILKEYSKPVPSTASAFKLSEIKNPFAKK